MTDSVTGWSKITQYDDKRFISIAELVETTWFTIYPRPMEITDDKGSEFTSHDYRKTPIEKSYWITTK